MLDGKLRAEETLRLCKATAMKLEMESGCQQVIRRMQINYKIPTMKLTRRERIGVRRQSKSMGC